MYNIIVLKIGDNAPDFESPDQNGKIYKRKDFSDSWLLIYFYPKDFTSGCIKEACSFRDNFNELAKRINIVGVSKDSVKSHKNFEDKYSLPFTLLSDEKGNMHNAYGTDGILFSKRTSFLIDPKGKIRKIYNKVDPKIHAAEILDDLEKLGV